jgi:hypothetical protein
VTHHIPQARGGVVQDYRGYLIGAGAVFAITGLAALWSML